MDFKGGRRFFSRIGRRRSAALAIGMALVAVVALAPSAASASNAPARYVYEVCDSALPGGGDAGVSFAVNPGVALTPTDSCNQPGGALRIDETGPVSATYSFWSVPIKAPPGGTIDSLTISAAKCGSGRHGRLRPRQRLAPGLPSRAAAQLPVQQLLRDRS